jgi:hypothetical protein
MADKTVITGAPLWARCAGFKYLASVAVLTYFGSANAEFATLKAADSYCKVEIRIGEYGRGNPMDMQLVHAASATKGQSWSGHEGQRVCGRRSGIGADCSSGATPWHCISPYRDLNPGKELIEDF